MDIHRLMTLQCYGAVNAVMQQLFDVGVLCQL